MGSKDSSLTRVAPVFAALVQKNRAWLSALLDLPAHGHPQAQGSAGLDLTLQETAWGDGDKRKEKSLAPPVSLLSWLVRNVTMPPGGKLPEAKDETQALRRKLIERDAATVGAALDCLRSAPAHKGWYVLEGPTYPDVYIETPDALVVIEGKRTEAGPTTHTTWMNSRHQMLRHIDAAWEIRGSRRVFGFFIVEGDHNGDVPQEWEVASRATVSKKALDGSLPHRGHGDRQGIAGAFLGVTTWQQVSRALNVQWASLPDTVP